MKLRPSLLMFTAAASAAAAIANGVTAAEPLTGQDRTRLGTAIEQDFGSRDAAALKRNRALELRERAARAAEARLQAELQARQQQEQQQQQAAQAAGGSASPTGEEQYDELARIYQAMKPAKAAAVFEQLAMDVQMKVAQRMRERATAMILANMTPKGAAELSMALARRRTSMASATTPPLRK